MSTFDNMLVAETGGKQFDSHGQVMRSSKGAVGIAQVMPATGPEAAKDAGLLVLKALPSAFGGELFTTVSTEIGAPALVTSLAEKAGSAGGDLAAQYGQSIMTQPIPVNYQSTVSLKPQAAR